MSAATTTWPPPPHPAGLQALVGRHGDEALTSTQVLRDPPLRGDRRRLHTLVTTGTGERIGGVERVHVVQHFDGGGSGYAAHAVNLWVAVDWRDQEIAWCSVLRLAIALVHESHHDPDLLTATDEQLAELAHRGRLAARVLDHRQLGSDIVTRYDAFDGVHTAALTSDPTNILGTGSTPAQAEASAREWLRRRS